VTHHLDAHVAGEPVGEERFEVPNGAAEDAAEAREGELCSYEPPELPGQRRAAELGLNRIEDALRNGEHCDGNQRAREPAQEPPGHNAGT
jgi:hypothetical protein